MNLSVLVIDTKGEMKKITLDKEQLSELSELLRTGGIVPITTENGKGVKKTYDVQAVLVTASGCKGQFIFVGESGETGETIRNH